MCVCSGVGVVILGGLSYALRVWLVSLICATWRYMSAARQGIRLVRECACDGGMLWGLCVWGVGWGLCIGLLWRFCIIGILRGLSALG